MANALLKLSTSYIGTNAGISIPLPATSTLSSGVCTDRSGNVYIADANRHVIYKVDLAGVKSILAGSAGHSGSTNGVSASARFNSPRGIAIDASGNLYVADTGNGRIRVIDIGLKVSTLVGGFSNVVDVSVAPNGDVIAVDSDESAVYRIEPGGRKFLAAGGSSGDVYGVVAGVKIKGSAAKFNAPEGVAVAADGRIYVADSGNHKIKVIETDGFVNLVSGSTSGDVDGSISVAKFRWPSDIAMTPKGNRLFVLDKVSGHNKIKAVSMNGTVEEVMEFSTADIIAMTVDVNETLYCVTSNAAGIKDGEESSESSMTPSSFSHSRSSESSESSSRGSSGSSGSSLSTKSTSSNSSKTESSESSESSSESSESSASSAST